MGLLLRRLLAGALAYLVTVLAGLGSKEVLRTATPHELQLQAVPFGPSVAYAQTSARPAQRAPAARRARTSGASRAAALDGSNFEQVEEAMLRAKRSETELYLQNRVKNIIGSLVTSPHSVSVRLSVDDKKLGPIKAGILGNRRLTRIDAERVYINTIEQMSALSFLTNARKMDVRITIDQTVKDATIRSLSESIKENLGLNMQRGDTLNVSKVDLQAEDTELQRRLKDALLRIDELTNKLQEKEVELQRKDSALRAADQALEAEREKVRLLDGKVTALQERVGTLTGELEKALGKLEEANKTIKKLEDRIKELEALLNGKADPTPWERFRKLIAGMELALAVLGVALLALLLVCLFQFLAWRRQKTGLATIDKVASNLSSAIEKIGGNIVDAARLQKDSDEGPGTDAQSGELDGENVELLRQESERAWLRLRENPTLTLVVLRDWLGNKKEHATFVQFAEGIGAKEAETLWAKLPREDIEGLGEVLMMHVPRVKAFLAVLRLARAVGRERSLRPSYFESLDLSVLVRVSDTKLASLLSELDLESLGRGLALLSAERCQKILPLIVGHERTDLLTSLQQAVSTTREQAEALLAALASQADQAEDEDGFDLTNHFALLLDSKDREEARAVAAVVSEDEEMRERLRGRVVTFDAFLGQERSFVGEELSKLSPEQLGALCHALGENERGTILGYFSGKLLYRIQAEFRRHDGSELARRRARLEGAKVQKQLTDGLRRLAAEGLVDLGEATAPGGSDSSGARGAGGAPGDVGLDQGGMPQAAGRRGVA